jgi:hypothetical protein
MPRGLFDVFPDMHEQIKKWTIEGHHRRIGRGKGRVPVPVTPFR